MSDAGAGPGELRVFVVEDEALVALNLEDMLTDLGCSVVGPAMRIGKALDFLSGSFDPDVAILDVNIAGEPIFPLAQQIAERGIPIVFATGYGRSGLPEEWHQRPILQKPYTIEDVSRSLVLAMQQSGRGAALGAG